MKGYHEQYRKDIANALTDNTMQLTYQEWLEYALADAERENTALQARIQAALAETEKANRDYRAMYAEHEGVFVDGYSGIAYILRGE